VVYSKEKGAAEKLNSPFHFEKELYIDRFLLDNRLFIIKNKPRLKALKNKRDLIMSELAKLKNYERSKFSILKIVDMAMQFIHTP
jgi:ubiquitin carboxyl-terminal hydrolase 25